MSFLFKPSSKISKMPVSEQGFFSELQPSNRSSEWGEKRDEGELAVDVVETADELIIIATMAGTKVEDIELHLHNDFLTIRGQRRSPVPVPQQHFYQECYWGYFSRTIILPVDVKSDMASSEYKNGLLLIHLPKVSTRSSIPILVIEE